MIHNILLAKIRCVPFKSIKGLNIIMYSFIHKCKPIIFENSLVYWTLQHFKSSLQYQTHPVNYLYNRSDYEIKTILKDVDKLSVIDINELLTCMIIVSKHLIKDNKTIENVDNELCKRLSVDSVTSDYKDVLQIADTLVYFTHSRIFMIESYRICVELITNILKCKEITLQHFIQCVFYISMMKDDPLTRVAMNIILKKMYFSTVILDTISPIDLAIFCNSIYKTSTKIKSKKILNAIVKAIDRDVDMLFMTPLLYISILKPLHQAKYQDYTFLKRLSEDILNKSRINVEKYEFTSIVYLLKLFTNALYNDENLINYLSDLAIGKMKNLFYNKEYVRAKDVSILFKSFCEIGYDSLIQKITDVLPIVYDIVDNQLFQKNELKSITEILLWISILDASTLDKNFINNFLNQQTIDIGKKKVKGIARMNLLLTILQIEKLLLLDKEHKLLRLIEPTEGYDLELLSTRRPKLHKIYQATQCLLVANKSVIKDVNIGCQIPNLYLPGIMIETMSNKKIAIESLDEKVCLYDTLIPNGYMKLKFRLLKKLGYKIITIPQNIVEEGSEHLIVTIDENITRMEEEHTSYV